MDQRPDDGELLAQIRVNTAFEKMILAGLVGTGVSAAAKALFDIAVLIASGAVAVGAIGGALFDAIAFGAVAFLFCFAGAVIVGVPLFRLLEEARIRKTWPYVAAAVAASLAATALVGRFPTFEAPLRAGLLAPGVLMALVFARLMRPLWRPVATELIRLH